MQSRQRQFTAAASRSYVLAGLAANRDDPVLYGAVARRVRAVLLAGPSKDFPWAHRWSTWALLPVGNDSDVPPRSSGTSPRYHRKTS
jgi:hypothetical protein